MHSRPPYLQTAAWVSCIYWIEISCKRGKPTNHHVAREGNGRLFTRRRKAGRSASVAVADRTDCWRRNLQRQSAAPPSCSTGGTRTQREYLGIHVREDTSFRRRYARHSRSAPTLPKVSKPSSRPRA